MAELADMLNELLSDPETGNKLRALLDDKKTSEIKPPSESENKSDSDVLSSLLSNTKSGSGDLSTIIQALSKNGSGDKDNKLSGILDSLKSGQNGALLPDGIDPSMMLKLTRAMAAMNSNQSDSRTRLLYDLKPYISKERARRVDEAAQMLRMLNVIDIFRDGNDNTSD